MNKKPIFDAIRSLLGRGFTQPEVVLLDRAIDRCLASRRRLGALSEQFESGGRGPGAVSLGGSDPGGVSYGIWQLSSRAGAAGAFVASEGRPWRDRLGEAAPGSEAFTAAWQEIAAREPEAFAEAQRAFIERTHYRPAVVAVRRQTGLDLDMRHAAVLDAAWSVAVQHGGAARILIAAVAAADRVSAREDGGYDRQLVEAIYRERAAYVARLAGRSGAPVRKMLEGIIRNRYPAERAAALAMFEASPEPA